MLLLSACSIQSPDRGQPDRSAASRHQDQLTRVLLYGHGYPLLYDGVEERIVTGVLPKFIAAVNELDPVALFGLGDLTHGGSVDEWSLLGRHLHQVRADVHLLRGNHELKELPPVYFEVGGSHDANRVVDIGEQRFILLDARPRYTAGDLAFLGRALTGHEERANTIVLMHYASFFARSLDDIPPDTGPTAAYNGYSNWNDDVVPLLNGKVDLVFAGDFYGRLAGLHESPAGIRYVCTGLPFFGEGPILFVELAFDETGKIAHILPHLLPLDLRGDWYRQAFPGHGPQAEIEQGIGQLRTVAVLTDENRARLATAALSRFLKAKSWLHVAEALEVHRVFNLEPRLPAVRPVSPRCWAIGPGDDEALISTDEPTFLVMLNPSDKAQRATVRWAEADVASSGASIQWRRLDHQAHEVESVPHAAQSFSTRLEPKAQGVVRVQLVGAERGVRAVPIVGVDITDV